MSQIYVTRETGNTLKVYGPFTAVKDAAMASFYGRSEASWEEWRKDTRPSKITARAYIESGVVSFGDSELATLLEYPDLGGYSRIVRKPSKALKMDASWSDFSEEFRRSYFEQVHA